MSLPGTYTPDVPQGPQQINNTQKPININFQDIYDLLAINHVPFNTANNFGKHNFVSYVQQNTDPNTASSEIALYSKAVAGDPNLLELFVRYPSNGTIVQLTPQTVSSSSSSPSGSSTTTSGSNFTIDNTILPNSGFGYVLNGYWQYLSNNTLVVVGSLGNYYTTKPTSPWTITFPGGIPVINGKQVPNFNNTPYCIITSAIEPYTNGQPIYTSMTATSKSNATAYYTGTVSPAPSTINDVTVMIIGN